ncbi:MAG: lipopolysaccharide heptosyltransferase II [Deltaproteobacteria bacterium]|nr:lipopolysaccharide heptosyltransferase II [Deltaproteobacteria bacterium]
MRLLEPSASQRILVRATNWVGDAVMTLPALAALHQACPQAEIEVLAKPWAAAVYGAQPGVSRVLAYDKAGEHAGAVGLLALARQLKARRYDWAVLMQNAFEAAFIAWLARIPTRLGYSRDGRGLLLTHRARLHPELRQVHETSYYLAILHQAGLLPADPPKEGVWPELILSKDDQAWAATYLEDVGLKDAQVLGLAPGAAFGPAKQWPAERFAQTARQLADRFDAVLLFGSAGEAAACEAVVQGLNGMAVRNLAGATDLGQALALVERTDLFITNDSGLMHAAAALKRPTVAVFGSTNPVTTRPLGPHTTLVREPVDCSPCLKPRCPNGDLKCFTAISPQQVSQAARELLDRAGEGA